MCPSHAVVCFDRREARVFEVTSQGTNTRQLCSRRRTCSMAEPVPGANDLAAVNRFFGTIVDTIGHADRWVVAGRAGVHNEFLAWLDHTWPTLSQRVILVRTCDEPTDGELLTFAMAPAVLQAAA
jgi:stalled ribosome rescue protein Dom34